MPLINAIKPTNAINIAPTFNASCIPALAPPAIASSTLVGFSESLSSGCLSENCSVCGNINFANNKPAGAAINDAAIKYVNGTPIPAYPAITEPAIDAVPPTMMANNSDWVIFLM